MGSTKQLQLWFPGTTSPFICNAPMYGFANAKLATAVTQAGGFGFIGGGFDFSDNSSQISALSSELSNARNLLDLPSKQSTLPVGVGFITFRPENFVRNIVPIISEHRVAAVWLFAPATRSQHTEIIRPLKAAGESWGLKVFVQVGSVQSAREAVEDGTDVLVIQGTDAGGHQWAQGASLVSLLPEVIDMLAKEYPDSHVSVIAAGGIMDGRGVAASLALGAHGVVMGTRFVATEECPSPQEVKSVMISTVDGSQSTIKSTVHDDIQGTGFWPETYDGRAIIGDSYRDFVSGLPVEENVLKHKKAIGDGDYSRKIVWAGSGVGLIKSVLTAADVVKGSQAEARNILERLRQS